MTITTNIQSIRNDVYGGGGPTDMASYGQLFFGRNNCSLSEFNGRSWWKSLTLPWTSTIFSDNSGGTFAVPARGNVYVYATEMYSDGEGGNENGYIAHDNSAGWNSFSHVDVPGVGTIPKGWFSWRGALWAYGGNWTNYNATGVVVTTITSNPVFHYAPI